MTISLLILSVMLNAHSDSEGSQVQYNIYFCEWFFHSCFSLNLKAVVFKVQKTLDSQQVYALKIYKDSLVSDWNQCFHEERILRKITENNQMYAASGMTFQIAAKIMFRIIFTQ